MLVDEHGRKCLCDRNLQRDREQKTEACEKCERVFVVGARVSWSAASDAYLGGVVGASAKGAGNMLAGQLRAGASNDFRLSNRKRMGWQRNTQSGVERERRRREGHTHTHTHTHTHIHTHTLSISLSLSLSTSPSEPTSLSFHIRTASCLVESKLSSEKTWLSSGGERAQYGLCWK